MYRTELTRWCLGIRRLFVGRIRWCKFLTQAKQNKKIYIYKKKKKLKALGAHIHHSEWPRHLNTNQQQQQQLLIHTKTSLFKRICNVHVYICRAEQAAIILALDWLLDYRPLRAVILTDSFSTLLLLKQSYFTANAIIQEIIVSYRELVLNGTEVTFCWIPSHCDIPANEIADQLAKKSTHSSQDRYEEFYRKTTFKKRHFWNFWGKGTIV